MRERPPERRLAAILAADVVGYSRLMGADELGTLLQLKACLRDSIKPAMASHHGRIVKTTGDGLLAEFPSAVEAVACAIEVQRCVALRNETVPEDKRLTFRIGINVGDIIIDANDIFGDGVNVAARLETLCEPGGLCISRAVREQVRDRLPITFEDLGEQKVKNIARPVRVFGLTPQAIAAAPDIEPVAPPPRASRRYAWMGLVLAILAFAGGAGAWWRMQETVTVARQNSGTTPAVAPAATTRATLAVLPLASLEEGGASYFADGLTEDIIAALGRFRELLVISRGGYLHIRARTLRPRRSGVI